MKLLLAFNGLVFPLFADNVISLKPGSQLTLSPENTGTVICEKEQPKFRVFIPAGTELYKGTGCNRGKEYVVGHSRGDVLIPLLSKRSCGAFGMDYLVENLVIQENGQANTVWVRSDSAHLISPD